MCETHRETHTHGLGSGDVFPRGDDMTHPDPKVVCDLPRDEIGEAAEIKQHFYQLFFLDSRLLFVLLATR